MNLVRLNRDLPSHREMSIFNTLFKFWLDRMGDDVLPKKEKLSPIEQVHETYDLLKMSLSFNERVLRLASRWVKTKSIEEITSVRIEWAREELEDIHEERRVSVARDLYLAEHVPPIEFYFSREGFEDLGERLQFCAYSSASTSTSVEVTLRSLLDYAEKGDEESYQESREELRKLCQEFKKKINEKKKAIQELLEFSKKFS